MSHGRSIHGRAIESKMAQAIFFQLLLLFGSGLSGLCTGEKEIDLLIEVEKVNRLFY
jgi:hypothetical protein